VIPSQASVYAFQAGATLTAQLVRLIALVSAFVRAHGNLRTTPRFLALPFFATSHPLRLELLAVLATVEIKLLAMRHLRIS
jgi:hypothetical protein